MPESERRTVQLRWNLQNAKLLPWPTVRPLCGYLGQDRGLICPDFCCIGPVELPGAGACLRRWCRIRHGDVDVEPRQPAISLEPAGCCSVNVLPVQFKLPSRTELRRETHGDDVVLRNVDGNLGWRRARAHPLRVSGRAVDVETILMMAEV